MSTLVKDRNGDWKQAAGNYSVWSGTRAELEAALAGGTIPNGTVAVVTDDYAMQGVSCVPDWDHAETVTAAQIGNGYTCPDNGIFVVGYMNNGSGLVIYLSVNGVRFDVNANASSYNSFGGSSVPVAKGDIITSNYSGGYYSIVSSFVPWKK